MSKRILVFQCPYCPSDRRSWQVDLDTLEAMANSRAKSVCFGGEEMEHQSILVFGRVQDRERRSPCQHAVSLCVDADLREGWGAGMPGTIVASAGVTWDHPFLLAIDPDRHLQCHLWESTSPTRTTETTCCLTRRGGHGCARHT
jgi:hypothetical protein